MFSCRIGGSVPIVYSYFSEFLQMDKRGEHLSWLCMFWMMGGIYASFTAWGIIPRYGTNIYLVIVERCKDKVPFSPLIFMFIACVLLYFRLGFQYGL